MKRGLFLLLALALAAPAGAQIIPTDRTTAWSTGVVGGIPARLTICATINAATYTGVNASAGIQTALDACPAGQTVLLGAGTFQINDLLLIHTGITLRGAGAGVTTLSKTDGAHPRTSRFVPVDPASYAYDPEPIATLGPQRWPTVDDTTSQALTVDGTKAGYTVTVASGTGFAAGQIVLLDELSGASWQATPTGFPGAALVWKGDRVAWNMHLPQQVFQDDAFSDATGPYQTLSPRTLPDAMSWFSRQDRPTNEIHEISTVVGNVVTFTTPIHITYRTSHTAQLTRYTGASVHVKNAGIENLTTSGGADGQVRFSNCANCWAKNIEVTQWIGEGIAVDASFRVEVRDSYIHTGSWPEPGGGGYALSLSHGTSELLFENNISYDACKNMVARSSGAGSVIAYNYTDDAWDFDSPTWQEVGINASHMAGPHHVLFEGNYAQNADSDYTHGNAIDMLFFRNWLTGQRASFTDVGNARAAGLAYGSWWDTFVGNVLGRSGLVGSWNYEAPAMGGVSTSWTGPNIWQIGYDPERFDFPLVADPDTLSTLIRDGNWDWKSSAQRWITTPATFTIPISLYLSATPAFFCANTFPWVNPATGSTLVLPAKARFDALTPNDVSCVDSGSGGDPIVPPPVGTVGTIAPIGRVQYMDNNGNPLSGGKLYTYRSGTTTPAATYTDSALTTPNGNPIVLDAAGRASIYLGLSSYKFVLKTSADATVWSQDQAGSIGLTKGGAYSVFYFGGSAASPITATSYPAGSTWDASHSETGWLVIDTAIIPPGVYKLSGMLLSTGGVNTVTAALVNLTDGSPDVPMVTISSTSATGANVLSDAITFPTPGGTSRKFAIKVRVTAGAGYCWNVQLLKVS